MKHTYVKFLVALMLLAGAVRAQSPTVCPITAGPNQSVCVPNCATATGTFVPTYATTNYTASTITYAPDPYNAGTTITLFDDSWSGAINIPFTFCFYGNAYNQLCVGSNGIITFNVAANANGYCQWPIGAAVPSAADPMNTIMGPWHDLYPPGGGQVRYATYGTAPCRRFVVSWYQLPMYSCTSTLCTQQVVLYETTNIIDNFIQTKALCTGWNGGDAIQAVHNAAGTAAVVQAGRNYPTNWTCTNDAKRWTPSGAATFVASWYQGVVAIPTTINAAAGTGTATLCPVTTTTYTFQATYTNCNASQVTVSSTMTVTTTGITLSGTQTNLSCNGVCNGTATTNIVSGTGPFTYSWAPSGGTAATATGLCAGTYTCTVTGAGGCQGTQTFTITQPPLLTATQSQVNVLCNGGNTGSATVTASGGTPGYTYSWAPSGGTGSTATGLTAGTYTCTITDANGCVITRIFTITQPPALSTTGSQVNVLCNGSCTGTATVNASGGTPGYTYNWAPAPGGGQGTATATGLCAAAYTVTVTDANGCTTTRIYTITQPPALNATTSSTTATCGSPNGSASVSASGGTPGYTYSWAPSGGTGSTATGLTAGTYTCTITDANGCVITRIVTVASTNSLAANITAQTNVSCFGGNNGTATVTPVGGNPGFTYAWAPGGGTGATGTNLAAGTYTVTVTDAGGCTATATVTITQPPALTTTGSQVNVACNGGNTGSATVNASGGAPGYTYSWAPSGGTGSTATGLSAGNYTVTVTDANGCTTTGIYTITQATAITAATSSTQASCGNPNGSATVTPSGGTPGYTYSWAPAGGTGSTATGLGAGTYTCTITDAAGCVFTATVAVTNSGSPSATITASTNISCFGGSNGSATVTASGGSPGYTYSWAPSGGTGATATGLTANTYTVTVTDALGCSAIATVTLTEPPALSASATSTPVLCNGGTTGTASVTASGGTPGYTYSWAPSGGTGPAATGLGAGTYTCTVTDANGCTTTAMTTITQPPALTATQSQVDILCNGGNTGSATVNASGGTPGYTYSWTPSGGTGATETGLAAGNYTCTITDANGCVITLMSNITQPAAISASTTIVQSTCGNPNGSATVNVSGGTPGYTYSWAPSGGTGSTATGLVANIYTVTITDANGCTTTATANVTNAGSPTATITSFTDVSCFAGTNGSATVAAAGGTGPYTYAWTPSGGTGTTATGLAAGSYNVTVTDANNCTTTASVLITEPPQLTATATATAVLCNGGSTGSASVTASGGTPGYTYNWTPSGGTGSTATGLAANSYTCTITDANGCTTTASVAVTEPTALAVTASQVDELCNGGNTGAATVNVSGGTPVYTYNWSPAPGGGQGTNNATGLTAGPYTCTITDANGCIITQNFTITEPTLMTLATTTVDATCGQTNGSATVIPAGGTPGYTYSWSSGGTLATENNLSANSYTVIVTDLNGCADSIVATVNNMASPTVTITSSTNVSCNGGNDGSATANGVGGTGILAYAWTPSGGTGTIATGLSIGTYTVTVTDDNGCQDTAQVTITEPPLLTVTTSQADELCFGGNTASALVTPSGGTPGYSYLWSNGPATATNAGLVAGPYSVTVTDTNGCTATTSITITEPTQLTLTTSQVDVSCFGGNNGSATVTASGATPGYTYAWAPTGGTGTTEINLAAGSYTVNVTDTNGCFTSASVTITEPPVVDVTATSVDAHCNQADGSVSALATGGTGTITFTWSPSGSGPTLTNILAGTYTVTATDSFGCVDSTTVTVNNLNGVTASATQVTNILCFGQSTGEIVITPVGGDAPYAYTWLPNVSVSDTASGLPAGSYQCTVTDSNGCASVVNVTLTQPAQLTITATSTPAAVCEGSPVTLNATPAGGTPAYSVEWTPGNLIGNTQTLVPPMSGPYSAVVTDANGCTAVAVVVVTVYPMPSAAVNADVFAGCAPVCVNFSDVSTIAAPGTITGWSWDFGDGNTSTQQVPNHCYDTPGAYTVILTVTSGDGCTSTITMPNYINVYANPVASFTAGPQPTTVMNPEIFFTDQSINADSWSWNFGDLVASSSTLQNPSFIYPDPTCYQVQLTVTTVDGCVDDTIQEVCIDPDVSLYVPNAFTPNDDGTNDVFLPLGIGMDPDKFEMWIFDRWGNLIFYTDDMARGWDGRVMAAQDIAQIDTYVWKIKATDMLGKKHDLIGKVSLIK